MSAKANQTYYVQMAEAVTTNKTMETRSLQAILPSPKLIGESHPCLLKLTYYVQMAESLASLKNGYWLMNTATKYMGVLIQWTETVEWTGLEWWNRMVEWSG